MWCAWRSTKPCRPRSWRSSTKNLELEREDIYKISGGPLSLVRVRSLTKLDRPDLKFPPFVPAMPAALAKDDEDEDIFAAIRRGDILLHHPFDSFQPVVGLLQKAARDPNVLAIKITLYRVGRNAPVVDALLEAVENGKQVAVLLELKARFDEESNIEWARKLEEYGVHVVYGLMGLKVHCKALLIVRKEGDVIRRYAHLSTGNYNSVTAQLYTDIGMLTCDPRDRRRLHRPVQLPDRLFRQDGLPQAAGGAGNAARAACEQLIEREIEHQKSRPRRSSDLQDECAGRQEDDPAAVSGLAGGSEGRPAGARHLLPAARAFRASATTSPSPALSAASWSTAASSTSATAAKRKSIWAAPT